MELFFWKDHPDGANICQAERYSLSIIFGWVKQDRTIQTSSLLNTEQPNSPKT
jgi:hypothetical protein